MRLRPCCVDQESRTSRRRRRWALTDADRCVASSPGTRTRRPNHPPARPSSSGGHSQSVTAENRERTAQTSWLKRARPDITIVRPSCRDSQWGTTDAASVTYRPSCPKAATHLLRVVGDGGKLRAKMAVAAPRQYSRCVRESLTDSRPDHRRPHLRVPRPEFAAAAAADVVVVVDAGVKISGINRGPAGRRPPTAAPRPDGRHVIVLMRTLLMSATQCAAAAGGGGGGAVLNVGHLPPARLMPQPRP